MRLVSMQTSLPGVEIGWRLAADYHNQGYATEAAKAVLSLAKSAGIERLFSFTAKINAPSERVMQKDWNGKGRRVQAS